MAQRCWLPGELPKDVPIRLFNLKTADRTLPCLGVWQEHAPALKRKAARNGREGPRENPGSGKWWIFVNHNNRHTSRLVGSKKAAEDAKQKIEARLTLGQWLPEEEPEEPALPSLKTYYDDTFGPLWEGSLSRNMYLSYHGSLPCLAK